SRLLPLLHDELATQQSLDGLARNEDTPPAMDGGNLLTVDERANAGFRAAQEFCRFMHAVKLWFDHDCSPPVKNRRVLRVIGRPAGDWRTACAAPAGGTVRARPAGFSRKGCCCGCCCCGVLLPRSYSPVGVAFMGFVKCSCSLTAPSFTKHSAATRPS